MIATPHMELAAEIVEQLLELRRCDSHRFDSIRLDATQTLTEALDAYEMRKALR